MPKQSNYPYPKRTTRYVWLVVDTIDEAVTTDKIVDNPSYTRSILFGQKASEILGESRAMNFTGERSDDRSVKVLEILYRRRHKPRRIFRGECSDGRFFTGESPAEDSRALFIGECSDGRFFTGESPSEDSRAFFIGERSDGRFFTGESPEKIPGHSL